MKRISSLLVMVACVTASQPSQAAKIYTCVVNGETVYTSRPAGNCHSADLPPIGRYSSARYDAPQPDAQPRAAVPQNNAALKSASTNRSNSRPQVAVAAPIPPVPPRNTKTGSGRRAILEQELANERKALANEQQALFAARATKAGSSNQQLVSQLQGSVLDRQQNIQALQRELGRM